MLSNGLSEPQPCIQAYVRVHVEDAAGKAPYHTYLDKIGRIVSCSMDAGVPAVLDQLGHDILIMTGRIYRAGCMLSESHDKGRHYRDGLYRHIPNRRRRTFIKVAGTSSIDKRFYRFGCVELSTMFRD